MENVKRTKDEVLQYLKDSNIAQGNKNLAKIAEDLAKMSETLDMQKPDDYQKLVTAIAADLHIKNTDLQNGLVKFLTGYSREKTEPVVEEHEDAEVPTPAESEITEKLTVREKVNNLIDRNVLEAVFVGVGSGIAAYGMMQTDTIGRKLGKGALSLVIGTGIAVGAVGGLVALKLGRGVIRFGTKVLKAALGTAAKAMHKRTLQKLRETTEALGEQEDILKGAYEDRIGDVDRQADELGLQDAAFYKKLTELRPEKEEDGTYKYGKLDTNKADKCKEALASEYQKASEQRDTQLIIMANADTYKLLTEKLSIEPNKAVEIIRDGIYIDEEGKVAIDSKYGISLEDLPPTELGCLSESIQTMSTFNRMTEMAKHELSEIIEFKDGNVQVKDDADMSKVKLSTQMLLASIEGQNVSIDENLFAEYTKSSAVIDLLIDCGRELVTATGIQATQDMARTVENKRAKLEEQKGFWGTLGEKVNLLALRQRAKAIVESRQGNMILPLIGKHADASRKLMELAEERLTSQERGAREEPEQPEIIVESDERGE